MKLPALDDILPHLEGVRRSGGGYVAYCPAHDDVLAQSLSLTTGDEQETILYCHAGCDFAAVATAIHRLVGNGAGGRGVAPRGTGGEAGNRADASGGEGSERVAQPMVDEPRDGATAAFLATGRPSGAREVVATYEYQDANGVPLYRQVRYEPKTFSREYPDGSGGWSSVRPADPPAGSLYRLPELLVAPLDRPVWVVEGEKDVDRLVSLGLVSVTSGGATSWRKEHGDHLAGRKLCIVPDNDAPGRKYALAVAASVQGRAASVRTLRLPCGVGGDVSDFLDAGHSLQDLFELAVRTREYPPRRWSPTDLAQAKLAPLEGFVADAIFCRQTVGMIAGRRGYGKTFLLLKLAEAIVTGQVWGPFRTRRGKVVLFSQEMTDVELRDRLTAMYSPGELANMTNLVIICRENVKIDTDEGAEKLAAMIEPLGADVAMIDTFSHVKGAVPENDNDEMGAAARRLIDIVATPLNCAVILTHHAGRAKADGTTNPRGASSWEDMLADIMYLDHPRDATYKVASFAEPNGKVRHAATPERMIYTIGSEEGRIEVDLMRDTGLLADRDTLIVKVRDLVGRAAMSLTVNEIAERLGVSRAMARETIQSARAIGLIQRFGTGADVRYGPSYGEPTEDPN